jgi:hypothetical protein
MRGKETVLGEKDQESGVDVGDEEDVPGDRGIILGSVLSSLGSTDFLEDHGEDNVGQGDPSSKSLGLP